MRYILYLHQFLVLSFLFLLSSITKTNASISDTIHVTHYAIYIDTINSSTKTIKGSCKVSLVTKINNFNSIKLSLLQLTIDSIIESGNPLTYIYNDTTINITPLTLLTLNDTISLQIYYHGSPKKDATGGNRLIHFPMPG